jgi:hypothetical protein
MPACMGINHWLPLHTQVWMCIIVDIIEEIDYKNIILNEVYLIFFFKVKEISLKGATQVHIKYTIGHLTRKKNTPNKIMKRKKIRKV